MAQKDQGDDQDITPLFKGERVDRAEVVVGLVGAMGTNMSKIEGELAAAFLSVGYRVELVWLSKLIGEFMTSEQIQIPSLEERTKLDELMDIGDALRAGLNHGGAAAVLAIGNIKRNRTEAGQVAGDAETPPPASLETPVLESLAGGEAGEDQALLPEREGIATIIRQLKHPQEVDVLRSIYGPRFVLLGVWSPEVEREEAVDRRLRDYHPSQPAEWYAQHVRRLLIRDEKDVTKTLGQRVRDTYELADAFIAVTDGYDSASQVNRFVHLLFGSPYETPTRDEHAMFVAAGASLRSSDAGRQVGAVVIDQDSEILVSGVNEIPKPGGGQYWSGDSPDRRDFRVGYDENARQKVDIVTEIVKSLKQMDWLDPAMGDESSEKLARKALSKGGPLAKSRVMDLLEFARVAHAEMAAISTAARRGVALGGHTMYTTTYPCHECARLIIASGIERVIYIDPYPKSQVSKMYAREVTESPQVGKVSFEPYRGIAPRLYRAVFRATGRSRDDLSGEYAKWRPEDALPRLVAEAQLLNNLVAAEDLFYEAAFELLMHTDWNEVLSKSFSEE